MRGRALLLSASLVAGCGEREAHDHSAAHPEGHDHHEEGHGHGGEAVASFTLWSDRFELFGEHSSAVAGEPISFLLHVTELDGFAAVEKSSATLELGGPATVSATAAETLRPGIFRVELTASKPGDYRGSLRIAGPVSGVIGGLEVTVHATAAAAAKTGEDEEDTGQIEFLKEQQWRVPFATAFVESGSLAATVEVSGRIDTPPGGSAEVGAPLAGRVVAPRGGLPHPGTEVTRGRLLATLVPAPSSPEEASRASLAVAEAEARLSAAQLARERADRLIRDEAISKREHEDAVREVSVATEAVSAARRAAAIYRGGGGGGASWRLTAPIAGTLVEVSATPGKTVGAGTPLFRVVDTSELWLVARVPEQDAARLRSDRDAAYRVAGLDAWKPIAITADGGARLIMVGKTVDRISRTVDVIYAIGGGDAALRVGGLVKLALPVGDEVRGAVIPRSALVDREGRDVVYVQVDGEHFEERAVKVGPRAGASVIAVAGVEPGERIVTTGAHLVRLAERAGGEQAHGHIH